MNHNSRVNLAVDFLRTFVGDRLSYEADTECMFLDGESVHEYDLRWRLHGEFKHPRLFTNIKVLYDAARIVAKETPYVSKVETYE